jgi:hypothetical protein
MRKVDIKRFAKHEAGHAVHFVMNFRERFEFVWIRRTDDEPVPEIPGRATERSGRGGGVFFQPNPQLFTTTATLVTNCMAGVAGERIKRKKPGRFTFVDILMGAESDWREARRHIQESNEQGLSKWFITDEDRFMNERFVDAWRQLTSLKTAHEAVTQALIERGKLTYDEVKALVYRAQGWNL